MEKQMTFRHVVKYSQPISTNYWSDSGTLPGILGNPDGVGIEVEAEGVKFPVDVDFHKDFLDWSLHRDGTLRNLGWEFVSPYLRGDQIIGAIDTLSENLGKQKKLSFSNRTSIHIHVDCRNLNLEQFSRLLITYMTVESVLFEYAGKKRYDSKFCVPSLLTLGGHLFSDMAGMDVAHFMELPICDKLSRYFGQHYAALNVDNLIKVDIRNPPKGSLEFRHMEGNMDRERIQNWIAMLLNLRNFAITTSTEELVDVLKGINVTSQYSKYLRSIFGDYSRILERLRPLEEIYRQISTGVTVAKSWMEKPEKPVDPVKFLNSNLAKRIQGISFKENGEHPPTENQIRLKRDNNLVIDDMIPLIRREVR